MKIKAPSFADLFAETSPQLGGARRTKFLETLDRIIPWQDLKALIFKDGVGDISLEVVKDGRNVVIKTAPKTSKKPRK